MERFGIIIGRNFFAYGTKLFALIKRGTGEASVDHCAKTKTTTSFLLLLELLAKNEAVPKRSSKKSL